MNNPDRLRIALALAFILSAFCLSPLLPKHSIDPWRLFNPRQFLELLTVLASIQVGSYLAIHFFGERFGMAITGFFSGLVSSTAYFAMLKNTMREYPEYDFAIIASGILATVAMLVVVNIVLFIWDFSGRHRHFPRNPRPI